jgi:hypothetical protein
LSDIGGVLISRYNPDNRRNIRRNLLLPHPVLIMLLVYLYGVPGTTGISLEELQNADRIM